jgi:F-type H+-transporting ATPase subunit gamma
MPSLKSLKTRIKSVKSTQKITKAMKMVAASKLKRARDAAEASRPYADKMEAMLARVSASVVGSADAPKLMTGTGAEQKHLLIVCAADRGLCGALNTSIIRATRRRISELQAQGKKVALYCVGKKAYELLTAEHKSLVVGKLQDVARRTVSYTSAEKIADEVIHGFDAGKYDVVTIVYNHFKSAISQTVTWHQLVPMQVGASEAVANALPYEYEPAEEEILADLLPKNLAMQLFKALMESAASEQGARMNAMENATKNAGEMIKKLTLQYNRTRQANITKELIEIISGAEAV